MAETNKKKYDKRVLFPSGEQGRFLSEAKQCFDLSWLEFAQKFGVHIRTLNDWRRQKYSVPLRVFEVVLRETGIDTPRGIKIKDPFWYASKGAKLGWQTVLKKYGHVGGDPEYRKKKRHEWWEREGKYNTNSICIAKSIKIPEFSDELAEFTGIVMGDGGLTNLQLEISCNKRDDKDYAFFVKNLIEGLFDVSVSICYPKDQLVMKLVVSRKKLVEFCNQKLGLCIGNKLKQGLDIPDWIKRKDSFQKACIRGLIDTDGCIFYERHKINGRIYSYRRLNFTSASPQLRFSVHDLLKQLGFSPKIRNNRCVQLEGKDDIKRYFDIISTHNPKHRKRFLEEYR